MEEGAFSIWQAHMTTACNEGRNQRGHPRGPFRKALARLRSPRPPRIESNQWQSVALSGNQWQSVAISDKAISVPAFSSSTED
jgi:hypothetical protein